MAIIKIYNDNQWTEARFRAFIVSTLRGASNRWGPKYSCRKSAWVSRGLYRCVGYKRTGHNVQASVKVAYKTGPKKGKLRTLNNVLVDHINPVVDPSIGFVDWDTFISRLFVERKGLQVLCRSCHDKKTTDETEQRKKIFNE